MRESIHFAATFVKLTELIAEKLKRSKIVKRRRNSEKIEREREKS
jgi:hypothetical protein